MVKADTKSLYILMIEVQNIIQEYEKRFSVLDNKINVSKRAQKTLRDTLDQEISNHNSSKQVIKVLDNEICSLKREVATRDSTITSLNQTIQTLFAQYKYLEDEMEVMRRPFDLSQDLTDQSMKIEKLISNTKIKSLQMEIHKLEDGVVERTRFIKNVIGENQQLKKDILKITAEYNEKILELKRQIKPEDEEYYRDDEVYQAKDEVEDPLIKQYYEYLLSLKTDEVETLKAQRNRYLEDYKCMMDKLAEAKQELALRKKFEFEGLISQEDLLIENQKLKAANKKYKEQLDFFTRQLPILENYKDKIKSIIHSNQNLLKMQQRILLLTRQIELQKTKFEEEKLCLSEENQFHKDEILKLRCTIQKYEIILDKFNLAFRKINPYFHIYNYKEENLDSNEIDLIDDIAFRQKQELIKEKIRFESEKNKFYFMINQRNKEKEDSQNQIQQLMADKHNLETLLQSKVLDKRDSVKEANSNIEKKSVKIIRDLNQKIHELRNKVRALESREDRLKNEIRITKNVNQPPTHSDLQLSAISEFKLDTYSIHLQVQQNGQSIQQQMIVIEKEVKNLNENIKMHEHKLVEQIRADNLKTLFDKFKQDLRKIQFENTELRKHIDHKNHQIDELHHSANNQEQPNYMLQEKYSVNHLPFEEFQEKNTISKEAMKQLADILATHQTFVSKLWQNFVTLKANYEKVLDKFKEAKSNPEVDSLNQIFKLKIEQLQKNLDNHQLLNYDRDQQLNSLRQENARIKAELQTRIATQQLAANLAKHKEAQLLSELELLKKEYSKRLNTSAMSAQGYTGNSKSIDILKELLKDKNLLIEELESQISKLSRNCKIESDADQFTVTEQAEIKRWLYEQNIGELLDKAVTVIAQLKS